MREHTIHHLACAALVVVLLAGFILSSRGAVAAQTGGSYTLTRSVISSGGGRLSGGSYTLAGVIGQPDAGRLTGDQYTLGGGFWSSADSPYHLYLPLVRR
jgi:hypothetical protein